MDTLTQKDGRNSKYFEIQEDGVFIKDNFAMQVQEYKVHFTDIQGDETVNRKLKDFVLLAIVISVLFNGIFLMIITDNYYNFSYSIGMIVFAVIMCPVFVIVGLCNSEFKTKNAKTLSAGKPIIFSYRKKEMEEVNSFITKIKESKKDFYLKTYYKVDNLIPAHVQISRIHWLYENKYINESDAKFILDEIDSKRIIEGL